MLSRVAAARMAARTWSALAKNSPDSGAQHGDAGDRLVFWVVAGVGPLAAAAWYPRSDVNTGSRIVSLLSGTLRCRFSPA
jgi:hypothetical protein